MTRILFLIISGLLILTLVFTAACGTNPDDEDDEEEDEDTATETPYTPIANDDFTSLYDTSAGKTYNPRVPKDWSFSGDYASSDSKAYDSSGTYTRYGTISVKDENFDENESKYRLDAIADWNGKEENKEKQLAAVNPYTKKYDKAIEDYYKLNDKSEVVEGRDDDKILMISHLRDTATRYKSSSITLQANAVLKISVRVFTAYFDPSVYYTANDLDNPSLNGYGRFPVISDSGKKITGDDGNTGNRSLGATISVTGGVENPLTVTGIDTDCGWKEYTFYLNGDSASSKTVYLELGLGSGDPSNRSYYTNGYAFFDNIETEFLTMGKAQEDLTALKTAGETPVERSLTGTVSTQIMKNRIPRTYPENSAFEKNDTAFYTFRFKGVGDDNGYLNSDGTTINSGVGSDIYHVLEENMDGALPTTGDHGDINKYYNDEYAAKPFDESFYGFSNVKQDGKLKTSNGVKFTLPEVDGNKLQIDENSYYRVTLWLKTSDFKSKSGANIYLINKSDPNYDKNYPLASSTSLTNLNTTTNEMKEEDREKDENGYYKLNGWRQYSLYVKGGTTGKLKDLELQVWYGPVSGSIQDSTTYPDTYGKTLSVLFTKPQIEEISSAYYSSASSGENVATKDLSITSSTKFANGGFTNQQTSASGDTNLVNQVVDPSGWEFLAGNDGNAPSGRGNLVSGVLSAKNHKNSGLLDITTEADILKMIDFGTGDLQNKDNSVLMLNGKVDTAFGYRSSSVSIPANSVYFINFWAYVLDGADNVNVYLTDAEGKVLTVEGKKVLRDENGDVKKDEDDNVLFEENEVTKQTTEKKLGQNASWQKYSFFFRTGAKAKTVTMEFWMGSKYIPEGTTDFGAFYESGVALFDDTHYDGKSKTASTGTALTPDQKKANKDVDKTFDEPFAILKGAGSEEAIAFKEKYGVDPRESAVYEKDYGFKISNCTFYDWSDLDYEEDKTDDSTTDDEEAPKQSMFGWLDIATLVMALALIFAIGAVAFRQVKKSNFYKNRKLRKASKQAKNRSYDRSNAKSVVKSDGNTISADELDKSLNDDADAELSSDDDLEEVVNEGLEGSEFDEDLETEENLEEHNEDKKDE